ncbi:MAG: S9 family peptidase [Senegalia sp. (in: firmicutes)]|uniref:S9 family peptidase n=1 Tax=Senegalia sp. (in: firmicutes) TaxID=1924098 RepID=UPI003F9D8126
MEKLKLDDFTNYKFLSQIKHGNEKDKFALLVHEIDKKENKYLSNIWVYDENKLKQLTRSDQENYFIWLNDEELLFSSDRDQSDKKNKKDKEIFTQFYKININGGEAKKYFKIDKNVTDIKRINDDKFVFTAIYDKQKENKEENKDEKEEKTFIEIDEIPFWSNGSGYTNKKRNRLYIYDLTKDSYQSISDELTNVSDFSLNDNKEKIVFTSNKYENKMKLTDSLYVYYIKNSELKTIDSGNFSYNYARFLNDDKLIVNATDMKNYGINENGKFYIYDLNNEDIQCITPDFDKSVWNSVGSDVRYGGNSNVGVENNHLYFITTENDSSYINKIDENGNIEKLVENTGSVDGFSIKDRQIYFVGLRDLKLQEIYELKDKKEEQISKFNTFVQEEKKLSKPQKLVIENNDVNIEGFLIKPVDFDENKKYPAILDIHGGPKTVYGNIFYHEMQYWANEGYVVFFCNPRGSDGKGNEFADIRGKYGTIDYEDIMKFTDQILDKYSFIDSEKVGVTGGSYGGFMTNWIIGHTNRFRAAASQRSISNWTSMYSTTDIGYYFTKDQIGETPWSDNDKLWEHSPLKYADKVNTPTLFIHGEKDYRCWVVEGIEMFTALKFHNVESKLCIFKDENHELSRSGKPKSRIDRLRQMTDWFDKYLK